MRHFVVAGALTSFVVLACASQGSSTPAAATSVADAGNASDGEAISTPGTDATAPSLCDGGDFKSHPECLEQSGGLFVDAASGEDSNDGTKAKPMKTIGAALEKTTGLVFVCDGEYPPFTIMKPVAIVGGFACVSWQHTGVKPRVRQTGAGFVIAIRNVTAAVSLTDVEVIASAATADGGNSIAVSAVSSSSITLRRCKVTAGNGKNGKAGADGAGAGTSATTLVGNTALFNLAGPTKTCSCDTGGSSTGGQGGLGLSAGVSNGLSGFPGMPSMPPSPATANGLGGLGTKDCNVFEPNGLGNRGADAAATLPGAAAAKRGALDANGFVASSGADGAAGTPGQGGGGGSSYERYGGGGGGCGGCGGRGGTGGQGGGASIALLSFESTVELVESELATGVGGHGGAGGAGAPGAVGGAGGQAANATAFGTCAGGSGGNGGAGGGGAGGAAGISIGILSTGTAPKRDLASTITPGTAGAPGTGGNPGLPGISTTTAELKDL